MRRRHSRLRTFEGVVELQTFHVKSLREHQAITLSSCALTCLLEYYQQRGYVEFRFTKCIDRDECVNKLFELMVTKNIFKAVGLNNMCCSIEL